MKKTIDHICIAFAYFMRYVLLGAALWHLYIAITNASRHKGIPNLIAFIVMLCCCYFADSDWVWRCRQWAKDYPEEVEEDE